MWIIVANDQCATLKIEKNFRDEVKWLGGPFRYSVLVTLFCLLVLSLLRMLGVFYYSCGFFFLSVPSVFASYI
jgi:hypothetical protein